MFPLDKIPCLFGRQTPAAAGDGELISFIREQLKLDNNKLREHVICSLFGITPTDGYKGMPDGEKDGVLYDVKTKELFFADGGQSIHTKGGWICLICDYCEEDGMPLYVIEVPFDCVYKELKDSAKQQQEKGGRVTPRVPWGVWANKPQSKVIFKRPERFPKNKNGSVKKRFAFIDSMPFQDKFVDPIK